MPRAPALARLLLLGGQPQQVAYGLRLASSPLPLPPLPWSSLPCSSPMQSFHTIHAEDTRGRVLPPPGPARGGGPPPARIG